MGYREQWKRILQVSRSFSKPPEPSKWLEKLELQRPNILELSKNNMLDSRESLLFKGLDMPLRGPCVEPPPHAQKKLDIPCTDYTNSPPGVFVGTMESERYTLLVK